MPEHAPRVERIDDAVVPQAGGRVVGAALVLVLREDRRLEFLLLLGRHRLVLGLVGLEPHGSRVDAACSPPMTEMRAFGHIQSWRGE